MSRRHLVLLLALGTIWGAAFMLIEIGLRGFGPAALVFLRVGSAALVLAAVLVAGRRARESLAAMRPFAGRLALAGSVNVAVPFVLISWGQQFIDSGVAAILNSSAPLWAALLAAFAVHSERVTGSRLVGLLVGFAGVVVLVGASPGEGGRAVAGSLAVVAAAAWYAAGALYTARRLSALSPFLVSFGQLGWSTLFLAPLGAVGLAAAEGGWGPLAAILVLGVLMTALGVTLYFWLIARTGASRAILVTYLVPSTALVYGVTLLGEPLRASGLVGLALVLSGVALGTGAVGRRRTASVPA